MELYWRVIDLSPLFSGTVESAADSIIALSSDPGIQRRALLWKMNSIPVAQSAIFRIDPVVALLDVWTFSVQMTDYYETGRGKDDFGQWQPIAVLACRRLEADIARIGAELAGDATSNRGKEFVEEWVKSHPIDNPFFVRESTRQYWTGVVKEQGHGVISDVQTITDAVRVLSDRMEAYYETLGKQMRWQAEMLVQDQLVRRQEIEAALADLHAVALMDTDVTDIAKDIDRIESQFLLLQMDFAEVVDSINAYWATATTAIQRERAGMDALIQREREAVFADLEALSIKLIDESVAEVRRSMVGLLLPAAVVFVILLAAPFALGFFTGRMTSRRTPPTRNIDHG
jgi:hypothetical protein